MSAVNAEPVAISHPGPVTQTWPVIRAILAAVSLLACLVMLVLCSRLREDLRRSHDSMQFTQEQLDQARQRVAQRHRERAAALVAEDLRPMAAELPRILRRIPRGMTAQRVTATSDEWRVSFVAPAAERVPQERVFSRAPVQEAQTRVADVDR